MPLGCSDKVLDLVRSKKCRSRSRGYSADHHHWLASQPVFVGTAPSGSGVTPTPTPTSTPTQVAAAALNNTGTSVNTSTVYMYGQVQPPQQRAHTTHAHAHAHAQAHEAQTHEAQTQRHSSQNPGTAGPPSTATMVGSRKKLQRAPPVSYQPSKTKRSSLPVIQPRPLHHVRPHETDRQPNRWTHPPHDGAPVPAVAAAALYGAAPTAPAVSVRVPACVAAAPAPAPAAVPAVVAPAARPAGDVPVIAAQTNHPK